MRWWCLLLLLSGCATSEYGRGCRDALNDAFTGPWVDWHDNFCNKLEAKHKCQQNPECKDR